ncbi:hypothetical protein Patl1_14002 [Pistacia atlantica]|uniref:Uncharacterized protein n=1 Tax=Pistacia atlantica TaxID=434234 RepID=A0ACC1AW10_9ROSI|nr:hypothetical protein Patl1_14002 [Pistacia atlantica]
MLSWLVSDEQAKNGVSSGSLIKSVVLQIVLKRLNWKWLLALSSLPSFVVLLFYGIVPESPSMQTKCGSTAKLSKAVNDSSLYTDVFLASLGELPRLVLAAILVDRVGRKFSMMVLFILTSDFPHTIDISNFCKVNRSWSGNRCGKNRWYDMPSCSSCHQTAAVILSEIVIVVAAISVRFIPFKTKGQAFEGHSLCTSGQARLQGMNKN